MVAVERFTRYLAEENQALLRRLFTGSEIEYCAASRRAAEHYAARFAAKEAFVKALGTGLRSGISWQDLEVCNDDLGKPLLRLSGWAARLAEEAGVVKSHLALSHDGGMAVAMVVLEG